MMEVALCKVLVAEIKMYDLVFECQERWKNLICIKELMALQQNISFRS
jgi:hypothetical protein